LSIAVQKDRIPHAVRSAKMQRRLSEASFEVIREVGYANFRTSAVSKRAGVSQGAQLHHYPTKDSLAIAALEYAYGEARGQFEENFASSENCDELLDRILKDFVDFYISDYFMVALDILMAGGKNEELHNQLTSMSRKFRDQVERAWLEKLIDEGWLLTLAEDVLALSHSLVRGFATRALIRNDQAEFDRLLRRWREMVSLLAGQTTAQPYQSRP
jgi:AcrR family transcriptional regulator